MMLTRHVSRESDERILRWLRRRKRTTAYQIGKAEGVNHGAVDRATRAVAVADMAESGEDVQGAYPWLK